MTAGAEVAVRHPQQQASALPAKIQYARALADSGLLPTSYRSQPANVLWAMEYGDMLGLAPMAAMTGVHVIEGKPTASAGLISALVRRAGHKLRVRGDAESATCEIVRADDPEYTFAVTFTMDDAKRANLTGKPVWRQYGPSMLKARAITQCARDACEEALFGLHYTAEELGAEVDEDGDVVAEAVPGAPLSQPSPAQEWLALALKAAPHNTSRDTCGVAWERSVEYVNDGKLTREEVAPLHGALRDRIAALKAAEVPAEAEVVEGEIVPDALSTDDPWAQKVEDLTSEDEAVEALVEASILLGSGDIDEARFQQIEAAILVPFPGANKAKAAA